MLTPKSKDDEIISLNNIDALFFGSHGQILQPERTEKKLENTKLAVDIEAVFLSQNPQKRAVVIKGKKNELLRIGDQLESGIIIDEIRSNVIILRRGDVLERLPIRDEFSGETGAPAESNSRSPMLLSKEAFDIKQRLDGLDQRLEGL